MFLILSQPLDIRLPKLFVLAELLSQGASRKVFVVDRVCWADRFSGPPIGGPWVDDEFGIRRSAVDILLPTSNADWMIPR
jgi:hypothetical protein